MEVLKINYFETMNEQLSRKDLLKAVLLSFGIAHYDFEEINGTTVTLYKFRPQIGVRVSKIRNLKDEIAATLGTQSVRITAPMEDGAVGIEIPNQKREIVSLESCIESEKFSNTDMALPCCLGRTITDDVFVADLAEMPHLLVAGATGQGKSVGLNVILMSLMNKLNPDELKFVLIDPKQVEFSVYENFPAAYFANLGTCENICTDIESAEETLEALCQVMEQRYSLLRESKVRNIKEYNASSTEKMPYVVVVVDEYGDLVMTSGAKVEKYICRIAQKARAVGIHMIISTQRPSATIVTGNIKANFPARIAFRTTNGTDSRIIIDRLGAEKLTGNGDMLFCTGIDSLRVQGAYVDTEYILGFRDELTLKYSDYENKCLLENEEEEIKIKLSSPLLPGIEEIAHKLADYCSEINDNVVYYVHGGYDIQAHKVLEQLMELGIVGPPVDYFHMKCRLMTQDKYKISAIINNYKRLCSGN